MQTLTIIYPLLAMFTLAALVTLAVLGTRLHAISRSRKHPQAFATPAGTAQLPDYTSNISNNFKNLCEAPILFYALCLTLAVTQQIDGLQVSLAWGFVALRGVHSLVQCTYNKVMHRFYAFLASSLLLWAMLIRLLLSLA